ncbi:hypothetical protein MUN86_29765 (plasmid) [Hymenobacter volaticus]|uniref:Beta-galactosidase n=1 Tax=Hymenobacter volaticus TaxID=2932254 RepID=A0ABY4GFX1_9BACT|nr:hypothetical protein [Hymenobacter volaticus]UOQ69801.1 hypothetical protein MUN86_29765 [Hymenobacter volaticus]
MNPIRRFALALWLSASMFGAGVAAHAQSKTPAPAPPVGPAPILSRWEKQVTATNAWREYPRPQMVRAQWQNLNGMWDYAITPEQLPRPLLSTGRFWCLSAWNRLCRR